MTTPPDRTDRRTAASFVHGANGPIAIITGRAAARIEEKIRNWRIEVRGQDPELDAQLVALTVVATEWRARHNLPIRPASAHGSTDAEAAEASAPSPPMVDTSTAATRLRMTSRAVRLACAAGRIDAQLVAGRWHITPEALAHYEAARAARTNP